MYDFGRLTLILVIWQGKKMLAQYSQQTIKKSVDMKSRLEEAILGTVNARTEMMRRRQNSQSGFPGLNPLSKF